MSDVSRLESPFSFLDQNVFNFYVSMNNVFFTDQICQTLDNLLDYIPRLIFIKNIQILVWISFWCERLSTVFLFEILDEIFKITFRTVLHEYVAKYIFLAYMNQFDYILLVQLAENFNFLFDTIHSVSFLIFVHRFWFHFDYFAS